MLKNIVALLPVVFLLGCPERIVPIAGPVYPPVDTGSEVVQFLVPPGSIVASSATRPGIQIEEYVPAGQTAEHWQEMITVLIMERSAAPDIDSFFERMTASFKAGCQVEAIVESPTRAFDGPYPSGTQMAVCGKSKRGFAEVVIYKMIQGTKGFFQVQRAWRFPPTERSQDITVSERMIELARESLSGVHVCDKQTDKNQCGILLSQ